MAGRRRRPHLAYAADHAALVDAFTRLAEATGEARWIARGPPRRPTRCSTCSGTTTAAACSPPATTPSSSIARPKDLLDNATPSANALAAVALLRLAALTGDRALPRPRRGRSCACSARLAGRAPDRASATCSAPSTCSSRGITEVVVVGDRPDLVEAVQRRATCPTPCWRGASPTTRPLWEGRDDGQAYVCRDYACQLPATDVEALLAQLT